MVHGRAVVGNVAVQAPVAIPGPTNPTQVMSIVGA